MRSSGRPRNPLSQPLIVEGGDIQVPLLQLVVNPPLTITPGAASHIEASGCRQSDAQCITESCSDLLELEHLLHLRLFVDAIQQTHCGLGKIPGHGFIGGKHELLDDAVSHEPLGSRDADHASLLVELDLRLRKVKIDGAAALPASRSAPEPTPSSARIDPPFFDSAAVRPHLHRVPPGHPCRSYAPRCESLPSPTHSGEWFPPRRSPSKPTIPADRLWDSGCRCRLKAQEATWERRGPENRPKFPAGALPGRPQFPDGRNGPRQRREHPAGRAFLPAAPRRPRHRNPSPSHRRW